MNKDKPIQVLMPHFPFSEEEYQARHDDPSAKPAIFDRIRTAAFNDISEILGSILPDLKTNSLPDSLNGPTSRQAFLTRIEDVLMHYSLLNTWDESKRLEDIQEITERFLVRAAGIVARASFRGKWGYDELIESNAYIIQIKIFSSVLLVNGQITLAISLLSRAGGLSYLESCITKGSLNNLPKKTWDQIHKIELVCGILNYLDQEIVPSRIHLQEERKMDKGDFSRYFSELAVKDLIPMGPLKPNKFLSSSPVTQNSPRKQLYSLDADSASKVQTGKFPDFMRQSHRPHMDDIRDGLLANFNKNYYEGRRNTYSAIINESSNTATGDVEAKIRHAKDVLGGLYWHIITVFEMEDLQTQDHLDKFYRHLRQVQSVMQP